ncbi:hypothetical protein GTX23_39250, partial [Streptomyces sp. SID6139]|nr:hypothetical protein [Streptomyces sp. SID6139]
MTRRAPAPRVLALLALACALTGCPVGHASADACAYASTGPDGTVAVASAGDVSVVASGGGGSAFAGGAWAFAGAGSASADGPPAPAGGAPVAMGGASVT